MNHPLVLLPQPQKVTFHDGGFRLHGIKLIRLIGPRPGELLFTAAKLQSVLKSSCSLDWEAAAGLAVPDEQVGISLCIDPQVAAQPQGYRITIDNRGVQITGHEAAGVFYGVSTLAQMIAQVGDHLPGVLIEDWPDFPARGVLLDVSRDKVYRMQTLYSLVDLLAGWKVNQLQLYFEHTFAYRNHPVVWANASPFTAQEILDLDRYCRERFIELVPNQNSFGHMQRWLKHPRYAPLAETHAAFMAPWGEMQGPFSLCPGDPESLKLVQSLYDELLPNFSSRMFNVGCDEAVDLGQGRSREACASRGVGNVYLEYLKDIDREVNLRGFTMQYWGDIIIHYPDLIPSLPKGAIALEWGYESDHPFGPHAEAFARAGVPYYLCPGTSTWNSIAGRTTNALGNLKSAAENGLAYGAIGYLNTDWGDNGHWQPLPASYLGLAMGAAYSWAYFANRDLDVAPAISRHAFQDASGGMGKVAYDLGEVYKTVGIPVHNSSALFWLLQLPVDVLRTHRELQGGSLISAIQAIDRAVDLLDHVAADSSSQALVQREFRLAAQMLQHAARRGLWVLESTGETASAADKVDRRALTKELEEMIDEYRAVWLLRNRPGGLEDSAGRLEILRKDYQ